MTPTPNHIQLYRIAADAGAKHNIYFDWFLRIIEIIECGVTFPLHCERGYTVRVLGLIHIYLRTLFVLTSYGCGRALSMKKTYKMRSNRIKVMHKYIIYGEKSKCRMRFRAMIFAIRTNISIAKSTPTYTLNGFKIFANEEKQKTFYYIPVISYICNMLILYMLCQRHRRRKL